MRSENERRQAAVRHGMLLLLARLARPLVLDGAPPDADGTLLVIRPDHLGDLLFATPALRRLRERLPEAYVTLFVGPWSAPVAARNPHVDEVVYCEFPWFSGRPRRSLGEPYALLLSWARRLRGRRFAGALNLRFDFWWGAALAYLAGIPYRVGYDTGECYPFLHPGVHYEPGRHEVAQNVRLVDRLCDAMGVAGGDEGTDCGPLEFPVAPEERAFASSYLAAKGVADGQPLVVVHPGTRAAVKRWSDEGFASAASVLARRLGGSVLVTGSKEERPLAESIARRVTVPAFVAAGETSVGELAALFERAALVLGVDSGPLHLATALDRPTVHLYGPSDHVAFGPYGAGSRHAVVRAGLDCSPCHRLDWPVAEIAEHPCMTAITVEQVLQAAERVLEGVCPREG